MTKLANYINGKWVAASATDYLDVENPATGEVLGRVPLSAEAVAPEAIQAALPV